MATRNVEPRRRRASTSTPIGPLGAVVAALLACVLMVGCPPAHPTGGGGGGATTHTQAFERGVSQAYIGAASVHEALVQGNFDGAHKLLDGVMRELQGARGRARVDEQRQLLRIEDRGLQLAALIDQRSPAALKASQGLMDAMVQHQMNVMHPPATAKAAAKPGAKPGSKAGAKPATRPGAKPKPMAAKPGAKPAAKAKKPAPPRAKPPRKAAAHATRAAAVVHPTRNAAAWPVHPTPARKGAHGKPADATLARVRLAKAVVGAIHAEQALLKGRMGAALGQVKLVRAALKQAHAKGTPWQRKALTRLDRQANQLQFELAHGNAAAFAHASGLVDASLKVQQSFKLAADNPGGGGGKPHPAKGHAPAKGKKPNAKKPAKGHPGKPHPGKAHPGKPKPHTKPTARPHPVVTPGLDLPPPPADPTLDEDHPGALPPRP